MRGEILLARDTAEVEVQDTATALCVRHPRHASPRTDPGCRHVTAAEYEADPRGAAEGRDVLVAVGLCRILTPQSRTRVGKLYLRPDPRWRRKVSVDRTLFVGDAPWRSWFHLGFAGVPYLGITYSFLAESRWRMHHERGIGQDPFALSTLVEHGRGHIRTWYRRYHDDVRVEVVPAGEAAHAAYQELKERCFDEERAPGGIVRRLAALAQELVPERRMPAPARLFDARALRIVRTDLPVDVWLAGRVQVLVALADGLGDAFLDQGSAATVGTRDQELLWA